MPIDLGMVDDGFLDIQVRPIDGEPVTVRCDVYREFHAFSRLAKGEHGDSEGEFFSAARDYLQTIGFPVLSTKTVAAVARTINERMTALREQAVLN